jgi:hypothetical protein
MMATEKRLIDAKAGKKLFCAIAKPAEYNGVIHLVVPISEIDKLPTVDAVEVVHGRWIPIRNKIHGYYMGLLCSECGHKATNKGGNYCPNCGAKMDGDVNG